MNKLTRISATVVSSLALVAGFTGVAGATSSISDSGRDSTNVVRQNNRVRTTVDNRNNVRLNNNTWQNADSGSVTVSNNDDVDGGQVMSGHAMNDNWTEASVEVDNSSSTAAALSGGSGSGGGSNWGGGEISDSGRESDNRISFNNTQTTRVQNTNNVTVDNQTDQTATSGDVRVSNNDDVQGSVSSGDAKNTNTSVFEVSVSN